MLCDDLEKWNGGGGGAQVGVSRGRGYINIYIYVYVYIYTMANLWFCMAENNTHCKAIILQFKTKNKPTLK